MKRYYRVHISAFPLSASELEAFQATLRSEWRPAETMFRRETNGVYFAQYVAEGPLRMGETESNFTRRICVALWRTMGRYVKVSIDIASDDDIFDNRELNEAEYKRLMRFAH